MIEKRKTLRGKTSGSRRAYLTAAILWLSAATAAADGQPSLTIAALAGETRLFDHQRNACEPWDIPDTPSRAYRDQNGDIHLFQTHFRNRALIGRDFAALRHSCDVVFEGKDRSDPASFDHRSWIGATYTNDGRTVYAIVHDEYRGHRFGGACAPDAPDACWYNALTAIVSHDGGASFAPMEPRLVAAVPLRAEETRGRRAGYFEPTNIIAWNQAFYMMANVVSPPPQKPGNCLLRTPALDDPGSWRLFRKGTFGTKSADPYASVRQADAHLCDPVDPAALPWPVTSLTRHAASGTFIATMKGRAKDEAGIERTGVYYSTSVDLVNWAGPALLFEAPIAGKDCPDLETLSYPALIDPRSPDRNFSLLTDRPALTFVRSAASQCGAGPARDIVMRAVAIAPRR